MMQPLHEQYRPQTFADVIGQNKVLARIDALRRRGLGGRAFWITGQSGTGKSTIGRLIAAELAEPMNVSELDATDLTPAALRDVERSMHFYGMGDKPGRAFIVNEAHGLRRDSVRQLLVLIERLPGHVVLIFTTTNDGEDSLFDDNEDAHPLLSRCTLLALSRRDLAKPFAARLRAIAQREGLDGQSDAAYVRLLQKYRNNLRAAFQAVEAGDMLND